MRDDFFLKPPKRPPGELNIVPIIDMLTAVIFFLLLSTTFVAFTEVTVPPSRVLASSDPLRPPPVAPKLFVARKGPAYSLSLRWGGINPGEENRRVKPDAEEELGESLRAEAQEIVRVFHSKYPQEISIQLGLGADVPYQGLVSVMDGIRESLPDVVLVSYEEVDRSPVAPSNPAQEGF